MQDDKRFFDVVLKQWVYYMTGGILAATMAVLGAFGVPIPSWIAWVFVVGGVIWAIYQAGLHSHNERRKLAEQLRAKLEICPGTERAGDRWRIRVRNLSAQTVRFSARIESLNPPPTHHIPAHLQITGSSPPHREAEIPGGGVSHVDVVLESWSWGFGILAAGHPPEPFVVPKSRHELVICAYTISPNGGSPARRRFSIIPQSGQRPDPPVILSDGGFVTG
jgi:hypothetical protein